MGHAQGLSDEKWRGYAEALVLSTESVDDLEHLIRTIRGIVGEARVEFVPIGDDVNNAGLGNVTDAMGSFVEKPTNSIDAYSDLRRDDETDADNVHELAKTHYESDESVYVVFDGDSPKGPAESDVNVATIDRGIGQSPESFPTFFDTLSSGAYKRGIPFFHGCRGVGGMAALGFTKGGHQVILSAAADEPNRWSLAICRQGADGTYEYMTVDGEIPTFKGTLDLGEPVGTMDHGSVVKLYGYEFERSPERATNEAFRRRFSNELENPAAPVHLVDRRVRGLPYEEYVYEGLEQAATGPYAPVFHDPVREIEYISDFCPVEIVMLGAKPPAERQSIAAEAETAVGADELASLNRFFTSGQTDGVLVSSNGRVHATETRHLLGSRGDLEHIHEEMYVIVRLLEPPASVDEGPFKLGRDGYTDGTVKQKIREAVWTAVRESERVQAWDDERMSEEDEPAETDTAPSLTATETTFTLDDGNDTVRVPVEWSGLPEDPVFAVTDDNLSVAGVEHGEQSATITIRVDADRQLSGAILETQTRTATETLTVKPSWTANEPRTAQSETALSDAIDCDVQTQAHRAALETMDEDTVSSVAAHIIEEHGSDAVLANADEIIDEATPLLKQLGAESGSTYPDQWARNAVGRLFEMLVYASLVDTCEQAGLTAYYEPNIGMFAGVSHDSTREPDTDIVVTRDADDADATLYVLSLKTSLKDRVAQIAYWNRVFRDASASCSDGACPVGSETLVSADCPIEYNYITLARDGTPNDVVLNELDGGYVPADKQTDAVENQAHLATLQADVLEDWALPTPEVEADEAVGFTTRLRRGLRNAATPTLRGLVSLFRP